MRFSPGHLRVTLRPGILIIGMSIATLLVAACGGGSRPVRPLPAGEQYLLKNTELETTRQANLYDAIRQLRPFWFTRDTRNRQGEGGLAVYLDDQLVGGVDALRRLPIHATATVRYMSPTEAQVRFGQNNGLRSAIVVESIRR